MNRQPRLPAIARRSIPVVVPSAPIQLPLALRWEHPVDRLAATREPEPATPVVAVRMRRAA